MSERIGFGVFIRQAGREWADFLAGVQLAEELEFDYAWVSDHFVTGDRGELPRLEGWMLLAGLAAVTSRIRLGVLVSGVTYRHPALLLKEAVTVDHISGGRVILGIGAGWHEAEHRMYGFPFPPAAERVDRVGEALELMGLLMSRERTTYEGRYYGLEDAPFEPKPVQRPRIPLLVGTDRPRMLGLAARYADMWDTIGEPEAVAERVRLLERRCREAGRNPREVRRSIREPEPGGVLGSAAAFAAFVEAYRPLGFTDFTVDLPMEMDPEVARSTASEVLPRLRG